MIGDLIDMQGRLKRLMPRWFGQDVQQTPVLDGLMRGPAAALAWAYALIAYAKLQTRIMTATDIWLDLVSYDFFGRGLPRKSGEADASFRARIIARLFRPRATRPALEAILTELTGYAPRIFEPMRPADTGAYGIACGYNVGGGYGCTVMAYQAFVIAFRPSGHGIPDIAGFGDPQGALNTGSQSEWADSGASLFAISDEDIMAAIESVRPAGVTLWVSVQNYAPIPQLNGGLSTFGDGAPFSDGGRFFQPYILM